MDTESYIDNYLAPVSLSAEDAEMPKAQIYKDISELRITPDEGTTGINNRTQFTFTNRNLDIVQMLHEAYITYKLKIESTASAAYVAAPDNAKYLAMVDEMDTLVAKCLPQTAFWIDGYTFEINDTTIDTQNSDLAKTLNVVNKGIYAKESRSVDYIGLASNQDANRSPFALQKSKVNTNELELKIPLKHIIPYFKDNKISWGTKTTIKLTKVPDMTAMFDGAPTGLALSFVDSSLELVVPYCKLENNKQLALWNSMYSSTNNRYWLGCDFFNSSPVDNTTSLTNITYRIATKGLNSRPRWLLLSAVDPDSASASGKFTPLGFGTDSVRGTYNGQESTLRLTKIRTKINGIYIDGGDVMEFKCPAAGTGIETQPYRSSSGDYYRAYENYLKFFGAYYSKRASPVSFQEWLKSQIFCIDLVNIDSEQIFANSGNALIIEIEYSYNAGSVSAGKTFKFICNLLYDKMLSIQHSENKAILNLT